MSVRLDTDMSSQCRAQRQKAGDNDVREGWKHLSERENGNSTTHNGYNKDFL